MPLVIGGWQSRPTILDMTIPPDPARMPQRYRHNNKPIDAHANQSLQHRRQALRPIAVRQASGLLRVADVRRKLIAMVSRPHNL
jgi:hypothetical protein